jgi:hypothetical protein
MQASCVATFASFSGREQSAVWGPEMPLRIADLCVVVMHEMTMQGSSSSRVCGSVSVVG